MERVVAVSAGLGHALRLLFADDTSGTVDLSARLFGRMFEPLRDPEFFSQVRVDKHGAICWPNGADLAPDGLDRCIAQTTNVLT